MGTLLDILNDLLQGRGPLTRELGRGLLLQFKNADAEWDESRLFCYRIEKAPSANEIKTVTNHIRRLVPQGTEIHIDPRDKQYPATDGKLRIGRVIRWSSSSFQPTLIDTPLFKSNYTEAK
jgi:hypothetical protein